MFLFGKSYVVTSFEQRMPWMIQPIQLRHRMCYCVIKQLCTDRVYLPEFTGGVCCCNYLYSLSANLYFLSIHFWNSASRYVLYFPSHFFWLLICLWENLIWSRLKHVTKELITPTMERKNLLYRTIITCMHILTYGCE